MRRIGVFGGTFDPPHVGHLVIAEHAVTQLGLDRVLFVPAGVPPHKRDRAIAKASHRLAMTRRAVRGNRSFEVSTIEVRRRGASYTIETLRAIAAEHRGARLYLVIGEDSLRDFHTWHEPEAILELATLAVAPRPLDPNARRRAPRSRTRRGIVRIDSPRLEISSSSIRERIRRGRTVRYLVPDAIAAYIVRHRLYRGAS
jgi:nicotinate-nucleotide adenylyltransferase